MKEAFKAFGNFVWNEVLYSHGTVVQLDRTTDGGPWGAFTRLSLFGVIYPAANPEPASATFLTFGAVSHQGTLYPDKTLLTLPAGQMRTDLLKAGSIHVSTYNWPHDSLFWRYRVAFWPDGRPKVEHPAAGPLAAQWIDPIYGPYPRWLIDEL